MAGSEKTADYGHPALQPGAVAVVTGAASGIGLAIARRFAAMGLGVAMLDVEAARLERAAGEVASGAPTAPEPFAVVADVSRAADLEAARSTLLRRFPDGPSVLVNNAATRVGGGVFSPVEDWRFAFDVNLWGVVNGVNVFAPAMIAARRPGLIVNLGSKQGITNPPGNTAYNMTKAAVRTFTEGLEHELRAASGRTVTAHLLVPGWTTTGDRAHKPGAWLPDRVVDYMLDGLARGAFYIVCPDDEVSEAMDRARILWTAGDITEDRPPLSRWLPEFSAAYAEFEKES